MALLGLNNAQGKHLALRVVQKQCGQSYDVEKRRGRKERDDFHRSKEAVPLLEVWGEKHLKLEIFPFVR